MAFSTPPYGHQSPPQHNPQVVAWFQAVDQDRSGRINAAELQSALASSNGRRFSDTAVRLMIGMYDGGTGSIDLHGFTYLYTYLNQWIETFRRFDSNGSGFIDQHELSECFRAMNLHFSPGFMADVVKKFGRNGPGMAVDEFIIACIMVHNLTYSFKQRDPHSQGMITVRYEDFLTMCLDTLAKTT